MSSSELIPEVGFDLIEINFSLGRYQIFSLYVEIFPCHNTKGEISQSVRFSYFEISPERRWKMKINTTYFFSCIIVIVFLIPFIFVLQQYSKHLPFK